MYTIFGLLLIFIAGQSVVFLRDVFILLEAIFYVQISLFKI